VTYGDGQRGRIRDAAGDQVDALIDTFGSGYVDLRSRSAWRRRGSTRSSTWKRPNGSGPRRREIVLVP
jgi:hypothetical protein